MAVEVVWAGIVSRNFPETDKSTGKHVVSKLPYCFYRDFREKPQKPELKNRELCGKARLVPLSYLRRILLVVIQSDKLGYSRFNFMRASSVVKRQSTGFDC